MEVNWLTRIDDLLGGLGTWSSWCFKDGAEWLMVVDGLLQRKSNGWKMH